MDALDGITGTTEMIPTVHELQKGQFVATFRVTGCNSGEEAEMCSGIPPKGSLYPGSTSFVVNVKAYPTDSPNVWTVEVTVE